MRKLAKKAGARNRDQRRPRAKVRSLEEARRAYHRGANALTREQAGAVSLLACVLTALAIWGGFELLMAVGFHAAFGAWPW